MASMHASATTTTGDSAAKPPKVIHTATRDLSLLRLEVRLHLPGTSSALVCNLAPQSLVAVDADAKSRATSPAMHTLIFALIFFRFFILPRNSLPKMKLNLRHLRWTVSCMNSTTCAATLSSRKSWLTLSAACSIAQWIFVSFKLPFPRPMPFWIY
jgi:hypothetical protein